MQSASSCAAKELCKASDLPLPLTGRHVCAVCKGAAHSAGLGCVHELDEVLHQLQRERMKKNHPDFPSSNTICLQCYQSYLLVPSDAASTKNDGPSTINSTTTTIAIAAVAVAPVAAVTAAASNTKVSEDNSKPKAFKPLVKKKAPKTFSLKRKLEILDEIDKGVLTQAAIIKRENTSKSAIFRWRADREKMRHQVDEDHRGDLKRQLKIDGLKRVKDGIYKFYDLNDTMPKSLRIPLTRKFPLSLSQHIPSLSYFICTSHNSSTLQIRVRHRYKSCNAQR